MKILLLSDLHMEFYGPPEMKLFGDALIYQGADVVVLAGDIHVRSRGVEWAGKTFPKSLPVIYVAGNHEFYEWNIDEVLQEIRSAADSFSNVHFLEKDAVTIGDITFLGTTLWTDFRIFGDGEALQTTMRVSKNSVRDFQVIYKPSADNKFRKFDPQDAAALFEENKAWLERELEGRDPQKTVVVTHHAPHWNSVHERYQLDDATGAFVSDLSSLMGRAKLWLHGHMHHGINYTVNGTNVVANPRGYMRQDGWWENRDYEPAMLIEV